MLAGDDTAIGGCIERAQLLSGVIYESDVLPKMMSGVPSKKSRAASPRNRRTQHGFQRSLLRTVRCQRSLRSWKAGLAG